MAAASRGLPVIDDPVDGLAPLGELPGSERTFLTDGELKVPVRRISVGGGRAAGRRLRPGRTAKRRSAQGAAQAAAALDRAARRARRHATSARCTTPAGASSPKRCASWRCAKNVTPEFVRDEVARGRAIIPANSQPPRARADDHRPQLPGEDQRQHRQLGGLVVDRRRGRQAALGGALGRRHGDGPVDGQGHPRDARVDHPQLAGADRHGADLPGAREGQGQGRGPEHRRLPRDAGRAGRAGRRLLHDPRRRAAALHPADRQAGDRHRLARRLDHGEVVPGAPPGELPLHALRADLRGDEEVRRVVLPRRRAAARLDRRRQRRGAVRRAARRWAS